MNIILGFYGPAEACSTCQCGDPTLTLMGNEKPFQGRLRVSGDFRYRTEDVGTPGINQNKLQEFRYTLNSAIAPVERLFLGLTLPFLQKNLEHVNGGEDHTFEFGDVDLRAKVFLSAPRAANHLYGLLGGIRFPTAPEVKDTSGTPLDFDVQPGTGAWAFHAGPWYSYFHYPWSLYVSSEYQEATEGNQNLQPGNALLSTVTTQYQTSYKVAFQFGLDSLFSGKDATNGTSDPDSGGFILFASPGLVLSPFVDWIFHVSVQVPVFNHLNGEHGQGLTILTGVTYDFSI